MAERKSVTISSMPCKRCMDHPLLGGLLRCNMGRIFGASDPATHHPEPAMSVLGLALPRLSAAPTGEPGLFARMLQAWCDHGRRMLEFGLEPF